MLTIAVPITSRADMNTGTPRVGQWTYHHVLPVRVYFLIASTILRIVIDPDCWDKARVLGIEALKSMCQYRANEQRIDLFLQDKKWLHVTPTAAEFADQAKLCGSPPFGGFGGPNPVQRSDDPHENEEPNRPLSADQTWWESLKAARQLIYTAYGLTGLPGTQTTISAAKDMHDWCRLVFLLHNAIDRAKIVGLPRHVHQDWACSDDNVWTVLPRKHLTMPNTRGPNMKLRLAVERSSYIDTIITPAEALARRGGHVLSPVDDYYYRATP